jgi:hypothetical protein
MKELGQAVSFLGSIAQAKLWGGRTSLPTPPLLCSTSFLATCSGSPGRQIWFQLHKTHIHLALLPNHSHSSSHWEAQNPGEHAHTFLVGTLIFKNSASLANTCHGACIRTKTNPWLLLCKTQRKKKWKHL